MAISHSSGSLNPEGPLVVQFDASVRTEPHYPTTSAAVGYVISSVASNTKLCMTNHSLGEQWEGEAKYAEFEALLAAVDSVIDLGYSGHIILHTDSAEVASTISTGAGGSNEDAEKYASIAQQKLQRFESYSVNKRPRDTNSLADNEARQGHHAASLRPYVHPE